MINSIQADHFTGALYTLLDETFDNVHGIFLDKGTSMFETLATISAAGASIPGGRPVRHAGGAGQARGLLPRRARAQRAHAAV